jgi:hypothetical protein
VDGFTLDGLVAELRPLLVGRPLGKPRIVGRDALALAVSTRGEPLLWLEAGRGIAGLYLLSKQRARALAALVDDAAAGRTRHALLLYRKHLAGRRVTSLGRIAGERTVVLEAGGALVALRVSGPAPAATLAVDGTPLATLGAGPPVWPLPPPTPERECHALTPGRLAEVAREHAGQERAGQRALLAAFPPLGPRLARSLLAGSTSLESLRGALADAGPVLLAPGPLESLADSDLEPEAAVQLVAFVTGEAHASVIKPASWGQAAALYLEARLRGRRFRRARRDAREHAGQRLRRLLQLEAHLIRDRAVLPDPEQLRQQAAALLAYGQRVVRGSEEALLPDPAAASATIRVALDPRLTAPANADRLFQKARRVTAAASRIEERLRATREALAPAREAEARVLAARRCEELPPPGAERAAGAAREKGGPRHYLTSHGLSILVGRGARENQRLTFQVAGPEDHWLHARGVPGSHVILRDNEGRARPRDLEEAAELAAFFSAARAESAVDVHVVRRKHLRPATGGPGRVRVGQSETLRVAPRDPEGRLRRR